jgi:hypothetical protein
LQFDNLSCPIFFEMPLPPPTKNVTTSNIKFPCDRTGISI